MRAKREYISEQIDASDGDNRKFWDTLQETFLKVTKHEVGQIYSPTTGEVLDGKEAADAINRYFCTVSEQLSKKFAPGISPEFKITEEGPYKY